MVLLDFPMWSSIKSQYYVVQGAFRSGISSTYKECDTPQFHVEEALVFRILQDLDIYISSSGYPSLSFIISFNKLGNIGTFSRLLQQIIKSKVEAVIGTSNLQPSYTELWIIWGPAICSNWCLKWGQCCGAEPLTCGI